jgi:hypothetical protein
MRASELRIGDLVSINGTSCRIVEISQKGWVHLEHEGNPLPLSDDYILNILEPILLTPSILETNHFKKCIMINEGCIDLETKPYQITEKLYLINGMCGTMACDMYGILSFNPLFKCKYVHQLQHILEDSEIVQRIFI